MVFNHSSIKSLYTRNLLRVPINLCRHKLNSIGKEEKPDDHPPKKSNRRLKITHVIEGTEIESEIFLEYIDTFETLNHKEWLQQFRFARNTKKWNEKQAISVLKALIDPNLHNIIEGTQKIEKCLEKILSTKYPRAEAGYHLQAAKLVKQENYPEINNYKKEIQNNIENYGLCLGLSTEEIQQKSEEIFMENLHEEVALEMNKLERNTMESIFETIKNAESRIIQNLKNKDLEEKIIYPMKKSSEEKKKTNTIKNFGAETKAIYWCKFHNRKAAHTTEQCEARKKHQENKAATIHTEVKNDCLVIPVEINNIKYRALLDTGASKCFISNSMVNKSNLSKINIPETQVTTANGQKETVNSSIKAPFKFPQIPNKTFQQSFIILPTSSEEIILGMDFIKKHNAIINLKDYTLSLDDSWIELECDEDKIEREVANKVSSHYSPESIIKQFKLKFGQRKSLGVIKNIEYKIDLTTDNPIVEGEYIVPLMDRQETRDHLKELIDLEIIRPSKSEYNSKAFIIKRNGKKRLVVNYKSMNDITHTQHYPFPAIKEKLLDIQKGVIFSNIDLKKGYHQIKVRDKDIKKTAFSIMGSKYEYMKVPFGLKNAPYFFQRVMTQLLGHLKYVSIFIDDILIFSPDTETHKTHLHEVMNILYEANITINFEKSAFFKKEVNYLGYTISKDGYRINTDESEKIVKLNRPTTKKKLMKLIGTIQWYRPIIKNLSKKLISITDKLKGNKSFNWSDDDSQKINEIVNEIKHNNTLSFPDLNKDFQLYTDASDQACGGVLKQGEKYIQIFSKKFTNSETKYSIVEKEFLSIILALKNFHSIVAGAKIHIFNDNKNVINYNKIESNRIHRWKFFLQEYNFTINHISGSKNKYADTLSREIGVNALKYDDITNIQNLHTQLSHPGQSILYNTIKNLVKIKHLKQIINKVTNECGICQTVKHHKNNAGLIKGNLHEDIPFRKISTDIVGPYKIYNNQEKIMGQVIYILTITDLCTRYTRVKIIRNIRSNTVVKAIQSKWLQEFKSPEILISDMGPQYTSENFKAFIKRYNIRHHFATANNATANAKSERINRAINEILRFNQVNKTDTKIESIIETRLNLCYNSAILTTPHELIFKRNSITNLKTLNYEQMLIQANENSKKRADQATINTNMKRKKHTYSFNEYVYLKNRTSTKQDLIWKGPYKILEIINENNLLIKRETITQKVNVKNIRKASLREGRI